jgi:hypothetical protein
MSKLRTATPKASTLRSKSTEQNTGPIADQPTVSVVTGNGFPSCCSVQAELG